jgi:hypothetical protein
MIRPEELPAKVEAVNVANKAANELYDRLAPIFRPLIGQQMFKSGGYLLARIEKLLPPMPGNVRVVWSSGVNRIAWEVTAHANYGPGGGTSSYHSVIVYVAWTKHDGTLERIADREDRKTNWTLDGIRNQREYVETLKKQYEAAKAELGPFAER